MKQIVYSLAIVCSFFIQCSVSPTPDLFEEPSPECVQLQEEVNDANGVYLDAFGDYIQDTQDLDKCRAYKKSLEQRISKNKAIIKAGCLQYPLLQNTQGAIDQDQETMKNLDC